MEVISISQDKINNYYWICSYWEVILLITYLLTMWMLKYFYRSVCYTSLNHGCWSHTCTYEAIHKYQIFFFFKWILVIWLKIWYHMFTHESDFFSPELSCIALRKNSAKANSGAVLSVLFCFCCNVSVTFIWTSNKGWSFDICDNLASYCTCALWKYFSNSYFLNPSWCLHLLSNRKINR